MGGCVSHIQTWRTWWCAMVDVSRLPEHMQESARLWAEQGLPHPHLLGSFMRAVLMSDLVEAFACADEGNATAMRAWAMWLYNDCPSPAWGNAEKLDAWHARCAAAREVTNA